MNLSQQEITKADTAGMSKWVAVFCWIVIFAGIYQLWMLVAFSFGNPVPETNAESSLVLTLRYAGSIGVIALGAIIGRLKGLAVSIFIVGMFLMAHSIFRV